MDEAFDVRHHIGIYLPCDEYSCLISVPHLTARFDHWKSKAGLGFDSWPAVEAEAAGNNTRLNY